MGTIEPFLTAGATDASASGQANAQIHAYLALRETAPLGLVVRAQAPAHSDTDLTGYGNTWFR